MVVSFPICSGLPSSEGVSSEEQNLELELKLILELELEVEFFEEDFLFFFLRFFFSGFPLSSLSFSESPQTIRVTSLNGPSANQLFMLSV